MKGTCPRAVLITLNLYLDHQILLLQSFVVVNSVILFFLYLPFYCPGIFFMKHKVSQEHRKTARQGLHFMPLGCLMLN